ncbi:MAG: hypothetical protein ABII20_07355 [Candidatus Omnitrophota bacterium]|nr:hypothetical protein [Candidatus Omnitrophota bacterium]MBU2529308.1 hypothetical protein [bacterium]MBU3930548.1 hypothetical protein [bacterium]MBU4123169.1 hypothetical protein [bacterium]
MENPIIVLGAVAVAFGVINTVLWFLLIKSDKKPSAPAGKTNDVQNAVIASEKRMIDTITKMLSALKGGGGAPVPIDTKKIAAEIAAGLKGQSQEIKLPELDELKKNSLELAGKIDSVEKSLKSISGEILKQKDFVEALDGHIVQLERPRA